MRRELTLSVMVLACASGAHAQLWRTQDWNTFGGDIGRTGMERTDPFLNKESVAKDFGLLYKGPYHVDALMRLPMIWRPAPGWPEAPAGWQPAGCRSYFLSSAHLLPDSGVKAWSPGTVPTSL